MASTDASTSHQGSSGKRQRPSNPLDDTLIKRNVFIKSKTLATPWANWDEFQSVGLGLVSAADTTTNDPHSISNALERVAIWRIRSHRLPHSIDSSAMLAQTLYREHSQHPSTSNCATTAELSLSYAAAIIRSINGLADALQQERAVASSVAQRSSQLGIPNWLVDIRHQATHNQLPSLAVLRMAATTLLHYFEAVYWDPLRKEREEFVQKARMHLEVYRKAVLQQCTQQESNQSQHTDALDGNHDKSAIEGGSISSVDSSDEEGGSAVNGAFYGSNLGTSRNSFALLQEPKKQKKKHILPEVETAAEEESDSKPRKKRKKKIKCESKAPTPSECARRFVKSNIPEDVAYETALAFLVDQANFVPNDPDVFPQTSAGFKKLRHNYSTLLCTVGKEWPGFLPALVVRLVDTILHLEGSLTKTETVADVFAVTRMLFFLSSWVKYLLTNAFLANFNLTLSVSKSIGTQYASLGVVQAANYPIYALQDRCSPPCGDYTNGGSKSSRNLHQIFTEIIQKADTADGDPHVAEGAVDDGDIFEDAAPEDDPSLAVFAPVGQSILTPLTVDRMECLPRASDDNKSMLRAVVRFQGSSRLDEPIPPQAEGAWELCDFWDPCSIGVLAGHPSHILQGSK